MRETGTIMTYEAALKSGKKIGASNCNETELLAWICSGLQLTCGAVSPKLVFEGAQKKGLKAKDIAKMVHDNPAAIEELMWV
jgi:hypothetical protein